MAFAFHEIWVLPMFILCPGWWNCLTRLKRMKIKYSSKMEWVNWFIGAKSCLEYSLHTDHQHGPGRLLGGRQRKANGRECDWLCSEFYAGSLTSGEGSLCMGIVFSKGVLDQRSKPTEAFWSQSPRISTIKWFSEDPHVHWSSRITTLSTTKIA